MENYNFLKTFKSNNIKKDNKEITINDAIIQISIENEFTEEMRLFINKVIEKELTFLNNYKTEKGSNIIVRVNNELVGYGRIEYGTMERITNNQLIMNNSFHANRICVSPEYRGNSFYELIMLIFFKYAHDNNFDSISCIIGVSKTTLHQKVLNLGWNEYYKIVNAPIGWDNFKSYGDCKVFKYTVSNNSNIDYKIEQFFK